MALPEICAIARWKAISVARKRCGLSSAALCSCKSLRRCSICAGVARCAAIRIIATSNCRRACLRCSSRSSEPDSRCMAASEICEITLSADSGSTRAPSPWTIATSPIRSNACSASRTAGRPTPRLAIRSRSEGSSEPTSNSPVRIRGNRRSKTSCDSLRLAIGADSSFEPA